MAWKSERYSRFSPVECALKAQSAIVKEAEVVGMTTDDLVLVRKLKGNLFHTVLRAKLLPDPEGTKIRMSAGMDRVVFVFACIFLCAFAALTIVFALAWLRVFQSFQFSDEDRKNWLFLSLPAISIAIGVGLAQLGRYLSRDEAPFLIRLVVEATEAQSKGKSTSRASA